MPRRLRAPCRTGRATPLEMFTAADRRAEFPACPGFFSEKTEYALHGD
jgi:hypothetical protein